MKLALTLLTASALFAQAPSAETARVFPFQHPKTQQTASELAVCVRAIAEVKDVFATVAELAVKGTPAQLEFVEWALSQLDVPPAPFAHSASTDFPFAGNPDDLVRILRVAHPPTIQAFHELATTIRSIMEIRRLYTYNATGSILLRGSQIDLDAARWIFDQLDQAPASTDSKPQTYTRPMPVNPNRGDLGNIIHILRPTQPLQFADFQEVTTAVRSIAEARRVYSYGPSRTLVIRGQAAEVDMVSWIFAQLDQPAQAKSTPVYRVPAVDDVVEILFLPQNQPVSAFQAEATRIRTVTNIRRVYTYNRLRALLVRGTASEVAEARRLVADLKQ